MSLTTALNSGLKGILAHQRQVEVTGNNIANVNTPGYSRQTLTISPSATVNIDGLLLGQGVDVESVNREYDKFVSGQLVGQNSTLGQESAKSAPLAELERVLGIGEDSLAGQIESFFGAWHDLSGNPSGSVERGQVIYKGENLLESFSQVKSDMVRVGQNINDKLNAEVGSINLKLQEVADLNAAIKEKETLGHVANTEKDRRDLLVKELSGILGVQTFNTGSGQIGLHLPGGIPLVQGDRALDFEAFYQGGDLQFEVRAGDVELSAKRTNFGGKFRGLLDMRDDFIPGLQQEIQQLEHRVVTEVNAQHAAGYGLDGETGRTFFSQTTGLQSETGFANTTDHNFGTGTIDVNGTSVNIDATNNSLSGIRGAINNADTGVVAAVVNNGGAYHLNLTPETPGGAVNFTSNLSGGSWTFSNQDADAELFDAVGSEDIHVQISDPRQVAAAGATAGEPGDNENALAVYALADSRDNPDGQTYVENYGRIAATVGTEAKRNTMARQGASDTMNQLENLRESIVGVSIEQEMMNLTRFQKGFEASSRYVQTIDEMMGTIIGMKR